MPQEGTTVISSLEPEQKGAYMSGQNGNNALAVLQGAPPPRGVVMTQAEVLLAEELFQMHVLPGGSDEAAKIVPYGADDSATPNAIVYHPGPVNFANALSMLRTCHLMSRSVEIPHVKLVEAFKWTRQASQHPKHRQFINAMEAYYLPTNGSQTDRRREVIYWGVNRRGRPIIPVAGEQTASLGGEIPTNIELGPFLWSVMRHLPMRRDGELMPALAYAATYNPDGKAYGGITRTWDTLLIDGAAYRYYVIKTKNPESEDGWTMRNLFALPVDLLWCCDVTVPEPEVTHWWGSLTVRAKSRIVRYEEPAFVPKGWSGKVFGWLFGWLLRKRTKIRLEFPDFDQVEKQLDGLVRRSTITGDGIMKAFRAFIPGSFENLGMGFGWHLQTNPRILIEEHSQFMAAYGDPDGSLPIGKQAGTDKVFALDATKVRSAILTGETGSGKTTLASALAKLISPYVFVYLLTSGTDEGAPVWVLEEGGETILIDSRADHGTELPEWAKPFPGQVKIYNKPDPRTLDELVNCIREDRLEADAIARAKYQRILENGIDGEVPVCVQVAEEGFRAYAFCHSLADAFEKLVQRPLYRRNRSKTVSLFDGIGSLPKATRHVPFGDMPKGIGDAFREYLGFFIRDCRKYGIVVFATSLTQDELEGDKSFFEAGFFRLFTLHIPLLIDTRVIPVIENPKQRKVLGRDIDVTLPEFAASYVGMRIMIK